MKSERNKVMIKFLRMSSVSSVHHTLRERHDDEIKK